MLEGTQLGIFAGRESTDKVFSFAVVELKNVFAHATLVHEHYL